MIHWKSIALLALVFLTGIVAGVVGTRAMARQAVAQASAHPEWVQMNLERNLSRRLWLDGDQQAQLHEVMTDARGHVADLRQEYRPRMQMIYQETDAKIEAFLRPGQRERYEKIRQQERQMFRPVRPGARGQN